MKLEKGQLVFSRAGRDVTKVYMVVGFEKERVLLADGDKYPLLAPKHKNIRHIAPTKTLFLAGQAESDHTLKAALAAYTAQHGPQSKED